jgi:AcrR family transcriptional regulator
VQDDRPKGRVADVPGTGPVRPLEKARRGTALRERLLDASAELFARQGYAGTSMRDIAAAAGVQVGAIYHHFASREALLVAVEQEAFRRMNETVDAATAGIVDPWARLEAAAAAHLEGVLGNRQFIDVTTRELPEGRDPELAETLRRLRDDYEQRFRAIVAELPLAPHVDRTLLRLTLLGAMAWTLVWYRAERGSPTAVAAGMVSLLRDGATAPRPREDAT